jgi:hypothetical protein
VVFGLIIEEVSLCILTSFQISVLILSPASCNFRLRIALSMSSYISVAAAFHPSGFSSWVSIIMVSRGLESFKSVLGERPCTLTRCRLIPLSVRTFLYTLSKEATICRASSELSVVSSGHVSGISLPGAARYRTFEVTKYSIVQAPVSMQVLARYLGI